MATEAIKYVDPGNSDGTDYTSYDAFEDAWGGYSAGNLISADVFVRAVGKCTNSAAQTAGIDVNGWGQIDTAHFVWFDSDDAYRFPGYYAAGNTVRFEVLNAYNMILNHSYTRVEGIAFNPVFQSSYMAHIYIGAACDKSLLIGNCFCGSAASCVNMYGVQLTSTATALKGYVINNLFYDFLSTTSRALTHGGTANASWYHYNNTICSAYVGIRAPTNGRDLCRNVIAYGCTRDYYGTFMAGSTNNGYTTANATITTAGIDLSGTTPNGLFFNFASKLFNLLPTCALADAGRDLSADANYSFSTDILDRARGATWDIGCFEYQLWDLVSRVSAPLVGVDGLLDLIAAAASATVFDMLGSILAPAVTVKGKYTFGFTFSRAAVTSPVVVVRGTQFPVRDLTSRVRTPVVGVRGTLTGKVTLKLEGNVTTPVVSVRGTCTRAVRLFGRPQTTVPSVRGLIVNVTTPTSTFRGLVIYGIGKKLAVQQRKKKRPTDKTRRIIPGGPSVTYLE